MTFLETELITLSSSEKKALDWFSDLRLDMPGFYSDKKLLFYLFLCDAILRGYGPLGLIISFSLKFSYDFFPGRLMS